MKGDPPLLPSSGLDTYTFGPMSFCGTEKGMVTWPREKDFATWWVWWGLCDFQTIEKMCSSMYLCA
jgi:hypothetical protein